MDKASALPSSLGHRDVVYPGGGDHRFVGVSMQQPGLEECVSCTKSRFCKRPWWLKLPLMLQDCAAVKGLCLGP